MFPIRRAREQNRKKAAELMRMDRGKEAQTYLRRCVDVTHEMALNLIRACRSRNVDCIVAPYEADAQLAFLNMQNLADVIVTEDSDLLLFGAKRVLILFSVCSQYKISKFNVNFVNRYYSKWM